MAEMCDCCDFGGGLTQKTGCVMMMVRSHGGDALAVTAFGA